MDEKFAFLGDDMELQLLMSELRDYFEGKFDVERTIKTALCRLYLHLAPLIQNKVWQKGDSI